MQDETCDLGHLYISSATMPISSTTTKIAEATPTPPHKKLLNCIINHLLKQSITKSTAIASEKLEIRQNTNMKTAEKT